MGQYHYVVNLDKHEFLHPHQLGAGLKLWEQLANHPGTPGALLILLAASNGRGGGDFDNGVDYTLDANDNMQKITDDQRNNLAETWIGRWAGDRIAVIGDYAEATDLDRSWWYTKGPFRPDDEPETIYARCVDGPPEPCTAVEHHPWNIECNPHEPNHCTHEHIERDNHVAAGHPLFINITRFIRPILERELSVRYVPPEYAHANENPWDSWLTHIPWDWAADPQPDPNNFTTNVPQEANHGT